MAADVFSFGTHPLMGKYLETAPTAGRGGAHPRHPGDECASAEATPSSTPWRNCSLSRSTCWAGPGDSGPWNPASSRMPRWGRTASPSMRSSRNATIRGRPELVLQVDQPPEPSVPPSVRSLANARAVGRRPSATSRGRSARPRWWTPSRRSGSRPCGASSSSRPALNGGGPGGRALVILLPGPAAAADRADEAAVES